ncbi:MAG: hypothetical protein PHP03_02395 [Candidatus Pacebacteria bacterium]|nr:hypothetical protein [Candidatus Paceibacterota bacterium]
MIPWGKLFKCFFCWGVRSDVQYWKLRKNAYENKVIVGQSFGQGPGKKPGRSNEDLAYIANKLKNYPYVDGMILQFEIADAFSEESKIPPENFPDENIYVIREHSTSDKYLDTYEVLRQAKEICDKRGWKKIVILAHPLHQWRVLMTAKKIFDEILVAEAESVAYDKDSVQWWTRSDIAFIAREISVRLLYLYKGWI